MGDYGIQTYAATDFFSSMFSAFSTGWTSVMGFVTDNVWLLILVGTPVVLGLVGTVISFIKSRM